MTMKLIESILKHRKKKVKARCLNQVFLCSIVVVLVSVRFCFSSNVRQEQLKVRALPESVRGSSVPEDQHFYTQSSLGSRSCRRLPSTRSSAWDHVQIVTYANTNTSRFQNEFLNFIRSADIAGYKNLDVIGPQEMPSSSANEYRLLRARDVLRYLQSRRGNSVIAIVDGFNTLVVSPPRVLLSRFRKYPERIFFAAERHCQSANCGNVEDTDELVVQVAPSSSGRLFISSPFIIGLAERLRIMFERTVEIMEERNVDEGEAFFDIWRDSNPKLPRLEIDFQSKFVGVISPAEEISGRGGWDLKNISRDGRREHVIVQSQSGFDPPFLYFPAVPSESKEDSSQNGCQIFNEHGYNTALDLARHSLFVLFPSSPRVVVSLTTTPGRVRYLGKTLRSLRTQSLTPSKIVVNIPFYSRRFKLPYRVPHEIENAEGVHVRRCNDYGPLTKLLPTILDEQDPKTLIITVDDEYEYSPFLVEELVKAHRANPGAAYGYAGQLIDVNEESQLGIAVRSADTALFSGGPTGVDIIEGFLGAIYRRDFFDTNVISKVPVDCTSTDDIWIAANLAHRGIPRIKLPFTRFPRAKELSHDKIAPSRAENLSGARKNDLCAFVLLENFQHARPPRPEGCAFRLLGRNASSCL